MLNCKHVSWKRFGSCQLTLSQTESRSGDGECAAIPAGSIPGKQQTSLPLSFFLCLASPFFTAFRLSRTRTHVLSFILWKCHSNNPVLFRKIKSQQKKKHKHTNGCILGPWKGNDCFVIWIGSGLDTWRKSQVPSLVVIGVINIVNLQESGLNFTGMAEDTCDTKVRILWTILSGTW